MVYVGDTRLNDGTAFANLCRAGGWPRLAFIGSERDEPARVEVVEQDGGTLYLANRWAALADFDRFCRERGFPLDERAAVIVDLDRTALGAPGRNDHVIDRARGVLLFGLSDKPDEASIPSDDLAAQGSLAVHQVETHAVGV